MEENKTKNFEEVKTEKKGKKGLLIFILIILLVAVGAVVGLKLYNKTEEKETVGTDWGDKYYEYLKKAQETEEKNKYGFENGAKEQKIRFLQANNSDDPNMVMEYEKDGEKRASIYFIVEDKIEYYMPETKSEVKMMYNIKKDDYDWYLLAEKEGKEEVSSVKEITQRNTQPEYKFENEEEKQEVFIEVETEDNSIKLEDIDNKEKLKENIKNAISEYTTDNKIITEEVKTEVQEKAKEIETKKLTQQALNANSEHLTVGSYTLKYGKYVGSDRKGGSDASGIPYDITIEIKADGTYNQTDKMQTGEIEEYKGTYTIDHGGAVADAYMLVFSEGGMFIVTGNNEMCFAAGSGSKLTYQEEKVKVITEHGKSEVIITNEGIKIGKDMIKYGTYENKLIKTQIPNNSNAYSIITIQPGGKFHIKTNVDISGGNIITPVDEDGTFTIRENVEEYPGTYEDFINFKTNSGMEFTLYTSMNNQWTGYEYTGK